VRKHGPDDIVGDVMQANADWAALAAEHRCANGM
jgi:hypothetical protein